MKTPVTALHSSWFSVFSRSIDWLPTARVRHFLGGLTRLELSGTYVHFEDSRDADSRSLPKLTYCFGQTETLRSLDTFGPVDHLVHRTAIGGIPASHLPLDGPVDGALAGWEHRDRMNTRGLKQENINKRRECFIDGDSIIFRSVLALIN